MRVRPSSECRKIFFIADIGTTTIKASLYAIDPLLPAACSLSAENCCGAPLAVLSEKNAQTVFGLDVISRVLYAHNNGVALLQKKVLCQLLSMLRSVCMQAGVPSDSVTAIILTGNTVMLHLVRGLSVQGFEMAPFTPVTAAAAEMTFCTVFESVLDDVSTGLTSDVLPPGTAPVYFPPCFDAFLGADGVCATLYAVVSEACFSACEEACFSGQRVLRFPVLIADVGTNTEIILIKPGNTAVSGKDALPQEFEVFCCSTAAGPAFEGGVLGGRYTGSELIHKLSGLLESGAMDETGLLIEKPAGLETCQLSGSGITQDAVRQLQLAKGAVCAAIETLLNEENVALEEIGSFILCGNFGSALSVNEAERIGLFPAGLSSVTRYAGNAAELGARFLADDGMKDLAERIAAAGKMIQLADSSFFARRYIECMNFPG